MTLLHSTPGSQWADLFGRSFSTRITYLLTETGHEISSVYNDMSEVVSTIIFSKDHNVIWEEEYCPLQQNPALVHARALEWLVRTRGKETYSCFD